MILYKSNGFFFFLVEKDARPKHIGIAHALQLSSVHGTKTIVHLLKAC